MLSQVPNPDSDDVLDLEPTADGFGYAVSIGRVRNDVRWLGPPYHQAVRHTISGPRSARMGSGFARIPGLATR